MYRSTVCIQLCSVYTAIVCVYSWTACVYRCTVCLYSCTVCAYSFLQYSTVVQCVCVRARTQLSVCVCTGVHGGQKPMLAVFLYLTILYFWCKVLPEPVPLEPAEVLCGHFPALGLQAHTVPSFLHRCRGPELRSPCLCRTYFTDWTVFLLLNAKLSLITHFQSSTLKFLRRE